MHDTGMNDESRSGEHGAHDDPVFAAEQEHLSETYRRLVALGKALTEKIRRIGAAAAADKDDLTGELTRNVASEGEALEMHVDFAIVNEIIDAYNLSHDVAAEKLRNVETLLPEPYFAKVALRYKPEQAPKELYIGNAGVSDERYQRLVVDWRSPVAEVYYNQDMGPTSYEANGRTIHADLVLRRQFNVDRDVLHGYFDSDIAIQDPLLLQSLSKKRSAHMQAITATIQKEQNAVVRHEDVPALMVSGIAGSGKTSVLLQRIAYLFYQHRGNLDTRDVFLISPNPLFGRYVANVLPDLGERNPEILTYRDLASRLMPEGRSLGGEATLGFDGLARIDRAVDSLRFEQRDFKDIVSHGVRMLSAASMWQLTQKFKNVKHGPHLIALMREELRERLESRINQLATSDATYDEIVSLSLDEQIRLFNGPYNPDGDEDAKRCALTYLREIHADAVLEVERDEWVRIDRIGMRLLDAETLPSSAWLYLKCAVTGMANASARYVMVDEAQDYTVDQLAVLARYFKRANLMFLGDPNQAIREGTATWEEAADVARRFRGGVGSCSLLTSYRSTPSITDLFSHLMPETERIHVRSVQRDERAPEVVECKGDAQRYRAKLERALATKDVEGLTAVIVPWKGEAKRLQKTLGEACPRFLSEDDEMPSEGAVMLTLPLAKGLEFDRVIVPDASERLFPADDRVARNRLYTTISRATRSITLIAEDQITPLLKVKRKA